MTLLDRAARLSRISGLETRTFQLLQARLLAQRRGELLNPAMAALVAQYGYIAADITPQSWGPDGCIESLPGLLAWLPDRASAHAGQAPAFR